MPRTKKRKTPAECSAQFSHTVSKTVKWRGEKDYKEYKNKRKTPKTIYGKRANKMTYQPKYVNKTILL
jgi:hypothetical protein